MADVRRSPRQSRVSTPPFTPPPPSHSHSTTSTANDAKSPPASSASSASSSASSAALTTPSSTSKHRANVVGNSAGRRSPRLVAAQVDMTTDFGDPAARTGLVYDERCLAHRADYKHVEGPHRLVAIFKLFAARGFLPRCRRVSARIATPEELLAAHTAAHVELITSSPSWSFPNPEVDSESEDDPTVYNGVKYLDQDTYVNASSDTAARLSIGGLIELATLVATGELQNGFAVIRPPGHHGEADKAGGFCLYNNVAVATQALRKLPGIQKVLIVDWDVHHGNGTQHIFEEDPNVLYFSVHRYQNGTFYPYTGAATEVGKGAGVGRTVNMPLPSDQLGDDEYLEVWRQLLIPIAREFAPDFVFISAGFDCAKGDPLGGMELSSEVFAHLTHMLMDPSVVKDGKLVIALEGGYNADAIAAAAVQCMHALLGDELPDLSMTGGVDALAHSARSNRKQAARRRVFDADLRNAIDVQAQYWQCMKDVASSVSSSNTKSKAKSKAKSNPKAKGNTKSNVKASPSSDASAITNSDYSSAPPPRTSNKGANDDDDDDEHDHEHDDDDNGDDDDDDSEEHGNGNDDVDDLKLPRPRSPKLKPKSKSHSHSHADADADVAMAGTGVGAKEDDDETASLAAVLASMSLNGAQSADHSSDSPANKGHAAASGVSPSSRTPPSHSSQSQPTSQGSHGRKTKPKS